MSSRKSIFTVNWIRVEGLVRFTGLTATNYFCVSRVSVAHLIC